MTKHHKRSPFYRIFKEPNRVALLDLFLMKGESLLSVSDIAEFTDLPQAEIEKHLEVLITANLVTKNNYLNRYCLDMTSEKAKQLRNYHHLIHDETIEDVLEATKDETQ